jgi:hypothetical protein
MFTINNPDNDQIPLEFEAKGVVQCIWQKEVGANGTPHLQGYLRMEKKCTLARMKDVHPTAHWDVRKGSHEQAEAYVTKAETRAAGPWRFGAAPAAGARNDLLAVYEDLKKGNSITQISDDHFGAFLKYSRGIEKWKLLHTAKNREWHTEVVVYWGPTGTGKSRRAMHEAGPNAYWMLQPGDGQACFFDGYEGQEHVVIDEFYGWIPYAVLLKMLDRYPLMVHTKGGATNFFPKKVWITSNKPPQEWYPKCAFPPLNRRLSPPNGQVVEMALSWAPPGAELPAQPLAPPAVFSPAPGIAQSSSFSVASDGPRVHGVVVQSSVSPKRSRVQQPPRRIQRRKVASTAPPPPPAAPQVVPTSTVSEPDEFGLYPLPFE